MAHSAPLMLAGRMAEHAVARTTRDGEAQLHLRVALPAPAGSRPAVVRAVHIYGAGPAAQAVAAQRATHLRRGARVELRAAAISQRRGHLLLDGVQWVYAPDIPAANGADKD